MSNTDVIALIDKLRIAGEHDANDMIEAGGQLLLTGSSMIDHAHYNSIIVALIEKVVKIEEEIQQQKNRNA